MGLIKFSVLFGNVLDWWPALLGRQYSHVWSTCLIPKHALDVKFNPENLQIFTLPKSARRRVMYSQPRLIRPLLISHYCSVCH